MIDKKTLCDKIIELYPDIGECGIDINVDYDEAQKTWVVDLKKDHHELRTFLEDGDAESCMDGKQCVSLGIEIAQLRDNIKML
ncbi:hypothetical protein ACFL7E_00535 [Thermodesulfobacteriota bacterium]